MRLTAPSDQHNENPQRLFMNDDKQSQLSNAQKEQKNQVAGQSDTADGGDGPPETIVSQADLVGSKGAAFLGLYFIGLGIALIYLMGVVWPPDFEIATLKAGLRPADRPKDVPSPIVFYKRTVSLPVATVGQAEKTSAHERTPAPTAGNLADNLEADPAMILVKKKSRL
jgi:hypothetical protein